MKTSEKYLPSAVITAVSAFFFAFSLLLFQGAGVPAAPGLTRVETRLREILSLPTVEHRYHDIIYMNSEKIIVFIPASSKQLLFSVDIIVRAGIDLSRGFRIVPAGRPGEAVRVYLPPAEVTLVDADEESIYQYFVRQQGDRIRLLEFGDEIRALKERVRSDAVERGILVRAEENAKKTISGFLALQGFSSVSFEPVPGDKTGGAPQ